MNLSNRYMAILLAIIVLGIYYPSIFAPFNSVDDVKMVNGLLNDNHFNLWDIFFPGGSGYYYRPLLHLSFWMDKFLWGLEESFMHLENILLHTTNVLLIFFITRLLCIKQGISENMPPFVAALLFALHPINTEAVNWISGRTDLLAGMFILVSIALLLISLQSGRLLCLIGAPLSFLLACLCKDSALFFLPGALFIICFAEEDKVMGLGHVISNIRKRASSYLLFLFVPVLYFSIRHLAFSGGDAGIGTASKVLVGQDVNWLYILRAGLKAAGFYAVKLFNPFPLNFAIVTVPDIYLYPGIAVVLCCCYLFYRRDLVSAFFLSSVSIGSSALLVVYGRMAWTPIAERYLYIPCATFVIAVLLTVYPKVKNVQRESLLLAVSGLMAIFGYGTVTRNIVWQDNLTLYEDTVRKSPEYPPARNELAIALLQHGRSEEAYRIFKKNSVTNQTNNKEFAADNRALALAAKGDLDGARFLLLESMDERSKNYLLLVGRLLEVDERRLKKTANPATVEQIRDEMAGLLQKMYSGTGDSFYLYRLGQNYMSRNRMAEARHYFAKAYEAAPDDAYFKQPAKKLAETLPR
jgi:hypothetical protein